MALTSKIFQFHLICYCFFSRDLSIEMSYRLLQTFFNVYESWWISDGQQRTSKKRNQTRLIQVIYDLRFVHMLLERKDNNPIKFLVNNNKKKR